MTDQQKAPDYGEPWSVTGFNVTGHRPIVDRCGQSAFYNEAKFPSGPRWERIVACVNACSGMDPLKMRRGYVAMMILAEYGCIDKDESGAPWLTLWTEKGSVLVARHNYRIYPIVIIAAARTLAAKGADIPELKLLDKE